MSEAVVCETVSAESPLLSAKVLSAPPGGPLTIERDQRPVAATRAFGCLVAPVAGDRVLVARLAEGWYVLSVLERLVPDGATLSLPSSGALTIEARRLHLAAREDARIEGASVAIRTASLTFLSEALTATGRLFTCVADTIRQSSRHQEVSADLLSTRTLDRMAVVERADILRAGSLTQTIDEVSTTTAPIAVVAAGEDLRLDGKRVTVG